jgi:hypothetical protein
MLRDEGNQKQVCQPSYLVEPGGVSIVKGSGLVIGLHTKFLTIWLKSLFFF